MQDFGLPLWGWVLVVIALVLLFTDLGKAYTFSEMRLAITYQGTPAKDARVVRIVEWQRERVDEFRTDEHGVVTLPQVRERSIIQYFPAEFVTAQVVDVYFDNREFRIWLNSKRDPAENAELRGQPLDLRCELTDAERLVDADRMMLVTNCVWGNTGA